MAGYARTPIRPVLPYHHRDSDMHLLVLFGLEEELLQQMLLIWEGSPSGQHISSDDSCLQPQQVFPA